MNQIVQTIQKKYKEVFNEEPSLIRAPGRVNLIGEHTDYNNGYVLPASIDKAIYLAIGKRNDEEIHLISVDLEDKFIGTVNKIDRNDKQWSLYILGVVNELQQAGHQVGGFNCVFSGDIPLGAGLSSSAALECGVAFGLNELFSLAVDKIGLVKLAQKAENDFVGVKCGIMDQFASMMGRKNKVIRLDCQSLEYEYNPLEMEGIEIVLFDSNVSHSLASSEYNTRREQCEKGVAWVQQKYPDVKTLRDVTQDMLDEIVQPEDPLVYRRCTFVVQENRRLLEGCDDLNRGDVAAFGKKMFATHTGLSKNYEVSCQELDYLIGCVENDPDVLGARMMGGGFGGCTINLVKTPAVAELTKKVAAAYKKDMKKDLKVYVAQTQDGVTLLN